MRRKRLILLGAGALGLAALLLLSIHRQLPIGQPGPAAEALAHRLVTAVDGAAWDRTGAVRWTFAGRRHHLWDRQRNWARVRWAESEVQLDLHTRRGLAWNRGEAASGTETADLVDEAWRHWVNDAFWLNPVVKVFDPGTERRLVTREDGAEALLVTYASGGATPGDSYLWLPGADDLPRAWRMWVSIIPVGGLEASWDGWQTLATGARVATRHRILFYTLRLEDVAGAASLQELEPGEDPFAALDAHLAR